MSTQRRMSRRGLLKDLALFGAAATLAACAPKVREVPAEKEPEVQQGAEAQEAAAPGETVITILCRAEYGGDPVRLYCQKFETAFPGLRAKTVDVAYAEHLKKIQAMYAAGDCPDVIYTQGKYGPYLMHQGIHLPLDELAEAHWEEYDFDDFYPSVFESCKFEDKLFQLPEWTSPTSRPLIAYNIDMLEEAGVPVPGDEWSFEDWKEAALKTAKPDEGIFGVTPPAFSNYYDWDAIVDCFGGHIVTEEVGLAKKFDFANNEANREAFAWLEDVRMNNHAAPRRGETLDKINMFTAGLMATSVDGLYHLVGLPKEVGDKFRYGVTLMKGPARKGAGMFVQGFGLSSQTKHPDEAFKLAYWQTSTEVGVWSATTGVGMGLQGRRSQWTDPSVLALHPIYGPVGEWLEGEVAPFPQPWNLRYQELYDEYLSLSDPLAYGDVTWDEAAPEIEKACQAIMDQPRP